MNVVKVGSRETMRTRAFYLLQKPYTVSTLRRRFACDLQTLPITYNLSVYICFYSFSMGFKDLATIGRMSFVRSLQFGIALDTAHQFSPWCGSARPHRCITLSCWAWEKRKRKKIYIYTVCPHRSSQQFWPEKAACAETSPKIKRCLNERACTYT